MTERELFLLRKWVQAEIHAAIETHKEREFYDLSVHSSNNPFGCFNNWELREQADKLLDELTLEIRKGA